MLSKKRRLNGNDLTTAENLSRLGVKTGVIARKFGVNKPSILKSLGLWDRPKRFPKTIIRSLNGA